MHPNHCKDHIYCLYCKCKQWPLLQSSACPPTPPSWSKLHATAKDDQLSWYCQAHAAAADDCVYCKWKQSLALYPSSPVTIQRHCNPRTVLHLRTGHSSMTEPRMIDQLDNEPIQSKHWRQDKTRQTIFPSLNFSPRTMTFFVITVPMSTSSPLSWTLPVTVPPTVSITVWCTYSGTIQSSDFLPQHQR